MYLGAIVESGPAEEIFAHPTHPYTQALLSSAPQIDPAERRERFRLGGETPSPFDVGAGCRLADRCPLVQPSCRVERPALLPVSPTHDVACPVVLNVEANQAAPATSTSPPREART
jgi:oligopeptide/dipeptide ABC transporter ATP-binding protein